MNNCLQTFEQQFSAIAKDTNGKNLFGIFSNEERLNEETDKVLLEKGIQTDDDQYESIKENTKRDLLESTKERIAKEVFQETLALDDQCLSYDLSKAKKTLIKISKNYPLLVKNIDGVPDFSEIDDIMKYLKQEIVKNNNLLNSNPTTTDENGDIVQLFDFSNISKLTSGVESLEKFISNELEAGFMKVIFINNIGIKADSSDSYEPFVVTNTALNHNINVYKNELWDYALKISGVNVPKGISEKLYFNDKVNNDLFLPNPKTGKSIYYDVMETLKSNMDHIFSKESPEQHIRLYKESGYSTSQGYLKALILANFDNFILNKHRDKITLNYDCINSFGNPSNGESKYKLAFKWAKKVKIDNNEKASDINESSSSLIKMLANVIPFWEINDKGKWEENSDFTIGKSNLDSIGAVLNDTNEKIKLVSQDKQEYKLSLAEAFKEYDKGNLSFEQILGDDSHGILEVTKRNNNLKSREAVIRSISEFMYGKKGINKSFEKWRLSNNDIADFVPNPEVAIINHLRNTVKVKYRIEDLQGAGRSVDALDIESAIGKDLEELVTNVEKAWNAKNITEADFDKINDVSSFFEFLNNPLKGGLRLSDKSQAQFEKLNINFDSKFKNTFKVLMPNNKSYSKEIIDPDSGIKKATSLDSEDIMDKLVEEETNNTLGLIDLFKSTHYGTKYSVVSTIKDAKGNSTPTMGIANPASLLNISIALAREKDFFKENQHLISGIEVLSEIENNGSSLGVSELNHTELFRYAFLRNFLNSTLNESKWFIQPWDFSDKSKVSGLSINADKGLYKDGAFTAPLKELSSVQLKNEFYNRQQDYYNNLINEVYEDYAKLDLSFFKSLKPKNTVEKLNIIDKYLQTFNNKDKSSVDLFREKINSAFDKDNYVEMVEDLHYSVYKKELRLNQLLKSNVLIFNNKQYFESYVKSKEDNLVKFIKNNNIYFSLDDLKGKIKDKFVKSSTKKSKLTELFKLSGDNVFYDAQISKSKTQPRITLYNEDGSPSELVSRYLWSRNLLISQYANLTTKDTFYHPIKSKFKEIDFKNPNEEWLTDYNTEENARSVVFTKRMNMPGASMTIYNRGNQGISPEIKIAAVDKPKVEAFNTVGEVAGIDTMDGGGISSPFFNELTIWSLPGLDLQKTQKPIGESINSKFATSLKFATFALDNEQIRNGAFSENSPYNMMKKMHQIDLYDNNYQNLLITKDRNGQEDTFDIGKAFPNLWIPINGDYYQFVSLKHNGRDLYSINYKDKKGLVVSSNPKQIKNLFDLWEIFGGAYSSKKENDVIIHTEDSINIVSSIVKKHSISNSPLKLKDKMISMLLPPSAIKKGVANINSLDTLLHPEKKLSWFKFDTSFFGVQLDPYHSTEDGETNEITQVMSAIAENSSTPELYNNVYNTTASIIKNSLDNFQGIISESDPVKKENKVNNIIQSFVKQLNNSSQINNARAIINGLEGDLNKIIPLSNKTIYKQFISHTISNINTEFIRRKFSGTASTLNPSQGIVTVFESNAGKIYLANDLLKKVMIEPVMLDKDSAFNEIHLKDISEFDKNKEKIRLYLAHSPEFKPQKVSINEVAPLDNIRLSEPITFGNKTYQAGETISLHKINDFFSFRSAINSLENPIIEKLFDSPRDLRPQQVSFTQSLNGTDVKRNTFDLESVNFSWWLERNKESLITTKLASADSMFNDFKEYISEINPNFNSLDLDVETKFNILQQYSKRWVNRNNELLSVNKNFGEYKDIKLEHPELNGFDTLFSVNGEKDNFAYRYEPHHLYEREVPISNYVFKEAENIHTNVHKANFNIANESKAMISNELFKTNIKTYTNQKPLPGTPYDIALSDYNTKQTIYIVLNGGRFKEDNGKLINLMKREDDPKREAGTKIFVNEDKLQNGDVVRRNNFGEKMYNLPEKYSMFKDKNDNEILLIKGNSIGESSEEELGKFVKQLSSYSIVRFNDFNNYTKNLKSDDSHDDMLKLINILDGAINVKYVRDYLYDKKQDYLKIKNELKDETNKSVIFKRYNEHLNGVDKKTFDKHIDKLSNVLYNSWEFSNKSLAARIPAQAMQSFQSMNTVAYLTGEANNIYVSHWQLWLQGSDFDIDKIYMMMYEFKNGMFAGWSPYFDMSNKKSAQDSFKLPMPNGKKYQWLNSASNEPFEVKLGYPEPNSENTLNISHITQNNKLSDLEKLTQVLGEVKDKDILYLEDDKNKFVNWSNRHNSFKSNAGFKNYVVNNLLETSNNPKNHISSYSPISFGAYEDIKNSIKSNELLSLYDGHSMFKQQENNSIGKAVIGIAATGLKNYFGLVKYYSDYYNKVNDISNSDNEFFHREVNLDGKKYTLNKIAGLNLTKLSSELLKNHLQTTLSNRNFLKSDGTNYTPEEINELITKLSKPDSDAALNISSILSLATDNAKELMLARINAGTDFAGMHIYLAMMGIDETTVAKYMTSPQALSIRNRISRDFFKGINLDSTISKLNSMFPKKFVDYQKALQNRDTVKANELLSANKDTWEKSAINPFALQEFVKIYNLASELTSMGGLFKVNQGAKSTQESIYGFSEQLKKIMAIKNKLYFSDFSKVQEEAPEENIERKIKYITNEKPYLIGHEDYVRDTLLKSAALDISQKGEIDPHRYFEDSEYRDTVSAYYNLIKGTFNVFDVLNKLPHFYNMYNSFLVGESFLIDTLNKYKIIKSIIPELLDDDVNGKKTIHVDSKDIDSKTRIFNDKSLSISFSNDTLDKINDWYDNVVLSKFIKEQNIKLDVDKLLDYLGKEKITLMRDDKNQILTDVYKKGDFINKFEEKSENQDIEGPIIDLSNEYGLAQFKFIMENNIIPFLKSKVGTNGFLKEYTFGKYKNYNLRNKINYYLDPSNLSELNNLEIGMSKLVKSDSQWFNLPIKKVKEGVENIKAVDLLYLYDLITNEGRFGGNRATVLFSKDINNKDSLSRKFIDYQKTTDSDKSYPDKLRQELINDSDFRKTMYFKLFGSTNPKTRAREVILVDGSDSDNPFKRVKGIPIVVNNPYYAILESIGNANYSKAPDISDYITDNIKSGKGNLKIKCN